MSLNDVTSEVSNAFESALNLAKENPITTSLLAAGAVATAGVATATVLSSRKKRTKRSKKSKSSKRNRKRSKRKTYKYAYTARKKRDRSTKRIRMTKSGQPYIILRSGKARFISKRSARLSRKRKGGRY